MAKLLFTIKEEDIVEKGKSFFFTVSEKYRNYYLSIKYPSGEEELIHIIKMKKIVRTNRFHNKVEFFMPIDITFVEYQKILRNVVLDAVSRFEKEGFVVENEQLMLFLNSKVDFLILEN